MFPPLNPSSLNRHFPTQPESASTNIAPNTNLEFASLNGKDYLLRPLYEKKLLFQWFNGSPARIGKDDTPIINTEESPYLRNIINAATIEKERVVGIFVDGDFLPSQKNAFSRLEYYYESIKVIYSDDIDFSMYDKKSSEIFTENISRLESTPKERRDDYLLEDLKKDLNDIHEHSDSLIKSHSLSKKYSWFDLYRNMAMLEASQLFLEADKPGCHDLPPKWWVHIS